MGVVEGRDRWMLRLRNRNDLALRYQLEVLLDTCCHVEDQKLLSSPSRMP